MRLTCPNCDAQYEVPDGAIPPEGRDVQCSNCSNTWYQHHPDHPEAATDVESDDDGAGPEAPIAPARRRLDPEVADILRQEAEHETRLRASEAETGLESQPDLGLDNGPDVAAPPQGREQPPSDAGKKKSEPQHNLLPDLEEISSTLRVSEQKNPGSDAADSPTPKRSGFLLGFGVIVLLAAGLLLIYTNAEKIAQTVPRTQPALAAYSDTVDTARIWLESVVTDITSQ